MAGWRLLALLVMAVAALAAAAFWRARPQPSRIAVLTHAAITQQALNGLRTGLAKRGWREGDNLTIFFDGPEPDPAILRQRAFEYVQQGAELLISLSTPAALAVKEVSVKTGIPLLLSPVSDPVAVGLVSSFQHVGERITGVSFIHQEARRLEWFHRMIPDRRTIWVPHNHSDPSPSQAVARIRPIADKLGLRLIETDIRDPSALAHALIHIPDQAQAVFIPPDALIASETPRIVEAAHLRGLPVSVPHRQGVAAGALMSYGFDLFSLGVQAARLADMILKGTPAQDIPIETAEAELSVNLASARTLNIALSDNMLLDAHIFGRDEK